MSKILLDRYEEFGIDGFSGEIIGDGDKRRFWIYAEECGDVEAVGVLVQKFLQTFRPRECWGMTFAAVCAAMRVGEFSGGCLFVTADNIKVIWAEDVYYELENEFKNRLQRQPSTQDQQQ